MKKSKMNILAEVGLWVFCALFFLPITFIILNSFKDFQEIILSPSTLPKSLKLDNFIEVWKQTDFLKVFMNTLFVTGISTLGIIIFCSMAGYKLSRTRTKTSSAILGIITISMMVPFQTIMIPLARVAKILNIYNNIFSLPFIYLGISCSLAILLYHGFTKTVPREMEEAATIDGCSSIKLFFKVVFPILTPVTSTVAVLYCLQYWNDITLPLILITKKDMSTITLSQLKFYEQLVASRWNLLLAAGLMAFIPVLVFYILMQKYIISGLVEGAVKS